MKSGYFQTPKWVVKLWKRYEEFLDWLVSQGHTKIGGYILVFSFSILVGLIIGLFVSELIK